MSASRFMFVVEAAAAILAESELSWKSHSALQSAGDVRFMARSCRLLVRGVEGVTRSCRALVPPAGKTDEGGREGPGRRGGG